MNGLLMSQFLDDELDLQEKVGFVKSLQESPLFASEMLEMLAQERLLHDITGYAPDLPKEKKLHQALPRSRRLQPLFLAAAVLLLCSLLCVHILQQVQYAPQALEYRFVLYRPSAMEASVIGTFTGWSPVPMEKVGSTGYWILSLQIPPGEHRYNFLLDRGGQMADPTVVTREQDDFGGENSILIVEGGDEPLS